MNVRAAVRADVDAVIALAAVVAEAPHWSREAYEQALAGGDASLQRCLLVAADGNRLLGFAAAACVAGEAELENVAVAERARRKGIGRALCGAVVEWARGLGAQAVALEVRSQSVGARAMYGPMGFAEVGRRRGYYRDPSDDAVQMRLRLAASKEAGDL